VSSIVRPTPIAPPALRPGDAVGLIAPASPFDRPRFEAGVAFLKALGFEPVWEESLFEADAYLAGPDERRLAELQRMARDPDIRAVLAVRGGYGTMRLLPDLDFAGIAGQPKIWIGFSDFTALHLAFQARTGLTTIHGPQLVTLPAAPAEAVERLLRLVARPEPLGTLFPEPAACWRPGAVSGWLLPANLTLLCCLLGTAYLPDLKGAILCLEDTGEAAYRIDRMLTHLELAGVFDRAAGLVAGQFTLNTDDPQTYAALVERRFKEIALRHGLPLLGGAPFGHLDANYPVPVGVRARLDADAGELTVLDPCVH